MEGREFKSSEYSIWWVNHVLGMRDRSLNIDSLYSRVCVFTYPDSSSKLVYPTREKYEPYIPSLVGCGL